jgi:hypothetical protein
MSDNLITPEEIKTLRAGAITIYTGNGDGLCGKERSDSSHTHKAQ